jgi:hypothetical protein
VALGAESLSGEIICSTSFVALDDRLDLGEGDLAGNASRGRPECSSDKSLDVACEVTAGGKSVVSESMLGKLHGGQAEREYFIASGGSEGDHHDW